LCRQALPQKDVPAKKRSSALDPAIFACISLLSRSLKSSIKVEVRDMLDSMLAVGEQRLSF
jgi:hypothetical protein